MNTIPHINILHFARIILKYLLMTFLWMNRETEEVNLVLKVNFVHKFTRIRV